MRTYDSILQMKKKKFPELYIPGCVLFHDYVRNASLIGQKKATDELTVTRASSGLYKDAGGGYKQFTSNQPRVGNNGLLVEELRTNAIRNNTANGAVVGTPGTLPTNWGKFIGGGVSDEVVGVGSENGMEYIDVRYFGTASSSSGCTVHFESTSGIAASDGETWNFSLMSKIVGGSTNDITNIRGNVGEINASGSTVQTNFNVIAPYSITNEIQQLFGTVTLSGGGTVTAIRPAHSITFNSGAVIDITIRLYLPQIEKGNFPSSPIKTTGSAATRMADEIEISPITDFFDGTECTIFAEFQKISEDTSSDQHGIVGFSDGGISNRISIRNVSNTNVVAILVDAGTIQMNNTVVSILDNLDVHYTALRIKPNDFSLFVDGEEETSDSSGGIPSGVDRLQIGKAAFGDQLAGYVRKVVVFNRGLSNEELKSLTDRN